MADYEHTYISWILYILAGMLKDNYNSAYTVRVIIRFDHDIFIAWSYIHIILVSL